MNQLMATQSYALEESAESMVSALLCDDALDCGTGLGGLKTRSESTVVQSCITLTVEVALYFLGWVYR